MSTEKQNGIELNKFQCNINDSYDNFVIQALIWKKTSEIFSMNTNCSVVFSEYLNLICVIHRC